MRAEHYLYPQCPIAVAATAKHIIKNATRSAEQAAFLGKLKENSWHISRGAPSEATHNTAEWPKSPGQPLHRLRQPTSARPST